MLIVLLMLGVAPSHASTTLMQTKTCSASSVNSTTCAFASNTGKGALLLTAAETTGGATLTISDSQTSTWATAGPVLFNFSTKNLYLFYAINTAGGADTITLTVTGGPANVVIILREYNGVATAAAFDKSSTNKSGDGTGLSPADSLATTTTAQANELLVGVLGVNSAFTSVTPGANYGDEVDISITGSHAIAMEDRTVSATGAYNATFSFTPDSDWGCIIATFKWQNPKKGFTRTGVGD